MLGPARSRARMDFYQQGPVALHHFRRDDAGVRDYVEVAARARPACVVLPMLYDEMTRPAIRGIRDGLRQLDYLNELVVPLTCEDEQEADDVRRFFADMPYPTRVIWCEGPEVTGVLEDLARRGLDLTTFRGKGMAVWLGIGAASVENEALVVHDADIQAYDPTMVDRLLLPVVSEELDFFFAKGYYARLTNEKFYGRVVRLFVWPFLDALQNTVDRPSPFLSYLRSFRYPLSGEMALTSDLAKNVRMPTDWGLELGLLGEVYRNTSAKRICQVDLGFYSHKHKPVGADKREGLQRMVSEIAAAVLRLMAANEGTKVTDDLLTTLRVTYRREAQDAIRRYHADSVMNRLQYDRHEEESTVEQFEGLIQDAGETYKAEPVSHQISEWLRAISADGEAPQRVRSAGLTRADETRLRDAARAQSL